MVSAEEKFKVNLEQGVRETNESEPTEHASLKIHNVVETRGACARFLVRDGANVGWIVYMLKGRQKSAFGGLFDSVIVESFYNRVL